MASYGQKCKVCEMKKKEKRRKIFETLLTRILGFAGAIASNIKCRLA